MTGNIPNRIQQYAQSSEYITPQDLVRRFSIDKKTAYNYLSRMGSEGIVVRIGYGQYESERSETFRIPISRTTLSVNSLIKGRMPSLDFTIWSTEDLGYLTHDTLGKNALMIETERRYIEPLKDLLTEEGFKAIADPSRDLMGKIFDYFDQPVLLFGRKEKYATELVDGLRRPTVERMIVDLYVLISREDFQIPLREFGNIARQILRVAPLNSRRLRRYAKRRGVWNELEPLFFLLSRNDPELDLPAELIQNAKKSIEPILSLYAELR